MIDRQALALELHEARKARMDAQAAGRGVEELIGRIQRSESAWRLLTHADCRSLAETVSKALAH